MKSTDDRLQPDISELFACSHHTDMTTLLIERRCFRLQLAVSEMVREAEDKLLSAVTSNQFHVCVACSRQPLSASTPSALGNMTLSCPQRMTRISSQGCCTVVCPIDNSRNVFA